MYMRNGVHIRSSVGINITRIDTSKLFSFEKNCRGKIQLLLEGLMMPSCIISLSHHIISHFVRREMSEFGINWCTITDNILFSHMMWRIFLMKVMSHSIRKLKERGSHYFESHEPLATEKHRATML